MRHHSVSRMQSRTNALFSKNTTTVQPNVLNIDRYNHTRRAGFSVLLPDLSIRTMTNQNEPKIQFTRTPCCLNGLRLLIYSLGWKMYRLPRYVQCEPNTSKEYL